MPDLVALDRLQSQLLTSGLQERNNALYQVISQLIAFLRLNINTTQAQITAIVTPSGSGGGSTILTNGSVMPLDSGDINSGADGMIGPPGPIGPIGKQGSQGIPGQDGQDGVDGMSIPGPTGPRGLQGIMGPPGLDGVCNCEGGLHFIGNVMIP